MDVSLSCPSFYWLYLHLYDNLPGHMLQSWVAEVCLSRHGYSDIDLWCVRGT